MAKSVVYYKGMLMSNSQGAVEEVIAPNLYIAEQLTRAAFAMNKAADFWQIQEVKMITRGDGFFCWDWKVVVDYCG